MTLLAPRCSTFSLPCVSTAPPASRRVDHTASCTTAASVAAIPWSVVTTCWRGRVVSVTLLPAAGNGSVPASSRMVSWPSTATTASLPAGGAATSTTADGHGSVANDHAGLPRWAEKATSTDCCSRPASRRHKLPWSTTNRLSAGVAWATGGTSAIKGTNSQRSPKLLVRKVARRAEGSVDGSKWMRAASNAAGTGSDADSVARAVSSSRRNSS